MSSTFSGATALRLFFEHRARSISGTPSSEELCWVSGREPRLWTDAAMVADMMASIRSQGGIETSHRMLEMGCAAGYLARELAPMCGEYVGVDVSDAAVQRAAGLGLKNATFQVADGTKLPFSDGEFDRSVSYDVFTNFDSFAIGEAIMEELVRVTKPGGKVLVGSIPDGARSEEYVEVCQKVSADLDERFGPRADFDPPEGWLAGFYRWYLTKMYATAPAIVCYYFQRSDFEAFGEKRGLKTEVLEIHEKNPYHGFRFNVVYTLPE